MKDFAKSIRTMNSNKEEIIQKKKEQGATLKVDNGQKLEFSDGTTYVKTSFSDDYREAHNYVGNYSVMAETAASTMTKEEFDFTIKAFKEELERAKREGRKESVKEYEEALKRAIELKKKYIGNKKVGNEDWRDIIESAKRMLADAKKFGWAETGYNGWTKEGLKDFEKRIKDLEERQKRENKTGNESILTKDGLVNYPDEEIGEINILKRELEGLMRMAEKDKSTDYSKQIEALKKEISEKKNKYALGNKKTGNKRYFTVEEEGGNSQNFSSLTEARKFADKWRAEGKQTIHIFEIEENDKDPDDFRIVRTHNESIDKQTWSLFKGLSKDAEKEVGNSFEVGSHITIQQNGKEYDVKVLKDMPSKVLVKGPNGAVIEVSKTDIVKVGNARSKEQLLADVRELTKYIKDHPGQDCEKEKRLLGQAKEELDKNYGVIVGNETLGQWAKAKPRVINDTTSEYNAEIQRLTKKAEELRQGKFKKVGNADPSQEIRDDYNREIYRLERKSEELERKGQGYEARKVREEIRKLERELRELGNKKTGNDFFGDHIKILGIPDKPQEPAKPQNGLSRARNSMAKK